MSKKAMNRPSKFHGLVELGTGGHGGPCLDGEWFVSDTHGGKKYPSSILYLRTDGSEICHTICKHMSSFYSHSARGWHPDHHSTHPHPNSSPDGTKTIFNSDFLGQYTDIYVAINRFPDPPRNLTAQTEGGEVVLRWKKPRRCRETLGYHVYYSTKSGVHYRRLTTKPVTATVWRSAVGELPGYYVITAVEHSGLESRPSNEAFQNGNDNWQDAVRLTIEAEAGKTVLPMREFIDQRTTSNGYYVACLAEGTDGSLTLEASVPKASQYYLWARVRGDGTLSVNCHGKAWGSVRCSADEWSWQKIESSMNLRPGRHDLKIQPATGGESIDKALLTDDAAFVPKGLLSLDSTAPDTPTNLEASSLSSNAIKLSWPKVKAKDVDHFNVYCGATADFALKQTSLIGSPSETEFVDWGLELNTSCWYRITAVDRFGNESPPTPAVQASPLPFEPVRIKLKPEDAKLENMRMTEVQAAGGKVLQPDTQDKSTATWEFELPRDGEYALWGRSIHKNAESSIFDLVIDEKPKIPWRIWGQWNKWLWSPAGNMITGSPQFFTLKAGKHTLRVKPKTQTSQIAEIVITDDPNWWPVEGMRK